MDRQARIDWLVDHYNAPRHKGRLEDAEVSMPGGNPGCGDVVTMHVRADRDGARITGLAFEGEGCTISQAAASILTDRVLREGMTLDDVRAMTYEDMMQVLGEEIVSTRPRCATLALGTLKAAVKRLQWNRRLAGAEGASTPASAGVEEEDGLVFGEGALEAAASPDPSTRPRDPLGAG